MRFEALHSMRVICGSNTHNTSGHTALGRTHGITSQLPPMNSRLETSRTSIHILLTTASNSIYRSYTYVGMYATAQWFAAYSIMSTVVGASLLQMRTMCTSGFRWSRWLWHWHWTAHFHHLTCDGHDAANIMITMMDAAALAVREIFVSIQMRTGKSFREISSSRSISLSYPV